MLVAAMVGILAAAAAPRISESVRRERASAETRKFVDIVQRARNLARLSRCSIELTVDTTSSKVTYGVAAAETGAGCDAVNTLQYSFKTPLVALATFKVSGTATNPLVFNHKGGTDYGVRASSSITNKVSLFTRTVEVWPAIGTVQEL